MGQSSPRAIAIKLLQPASCDSTEQSRLADGGISNVTLALDSDLGDEFCGIPITHPISRLRCIQLARPSSETRRCVLLQLRLVLRQPGVNAVHRYIIVGLAMVASAGLGAAAVQTLHAQTKPPAYNIA